jgi:tRNA(fMet)-specific endonuclease VapC
MLPAMLDTDILSEVMRGRNPVVQERALAYLAEYQRLSFSLITRYEILRGLRAEHTTRQILAFDALCRASDVLPLTEPIAVRAAEIYANFRQQGQIISDADILIAATALTYGLMLVTTNVVHFARVGGLRVENWIKNWKELP